MTGYSETVTHRSMPRLLRPESVHGQVSTRPTLRDNDLAWPACPPQATDVGFVYLATPKEPNFETVKPRLKLTNGPVASPHAAGTGSDPLAASVTAKV